LAPSLQGSALAQATAAKPLTQAAAERLATEVLERVDEVNRESKYAYRVDKVLIFDSYLFGSCLSQQARPNDVDVAVRLVPRDSGTRQQNAEESRRRAHRSDFRNTFERAAWPKLEVL
jgi:hypothetical protein